MKKRFLFFGLILLILAFWLSKPQPKTLAYNQSPYGVHIGTNEIFWQKTEPDKNYPRMAVLLREAGVKWTLATLSWQRAEPKNNEWEEAYLGKLQSLLQALQGEGINVGLTFGLMTDWSSNVPKCPPSDLGEWDEFVRRMANRFAGNLVQAWAIGGEVSGKECFIKEENREVYTKMVKRAARIIKREDPNAIILLTSIAVPPEQQQKKIDAIKYWLETAGPYVDALNVHKHLPDDKHVIEAIRRYKSWIPAGIRNKPIWLTSTNVCRPELDDYCREPEFGAKKLPIRYEVVLNIGIKKVFWWKIISGSWGPGILEPPWKTESGQYEPHEPVYSVYREMATGKKRISLSSEWNKIAWPDISGYKASHIPPECPIAVAKENFWFTPYVKNFGGLNFDFESGKTYYLKCNQDIVWQL